jgi:primase-polymerase (primpol)-like protein
LKARALPLELVTLDRWVRHADKRPLSVTGSPASSTDARTWSSYAEALSSSVGDGLGFVLGGGIACIDIDDCMVDGTPDSRAAALLRRFSSAYVEVSPSGRGLHIWGLAPERRGRRFDTYEVYSAGRYVTITGNVYRHGTLVDLSDAF